MSNVIKIVLRLDDAGLQKFKTVPAFTSLVHPKILDRLIVGDNIIKVSDVAYEQLKQLSKPGEVEKDISEETSLGSVMGSTSDPNGGYFIGPLSKVSQAKLNKRILWKWKGAKNSTGAVGKIVTPPQGYLKEHLYDVEGNMITEESLDSWFGADLKQKPSFNGGKIMSIEPKCLAFPYCSQGAIDKPVKLIGESKESMCEHCYGYVSQIAEATGKKPEIIAKIIREKYLSL